MTSSRNREKPEASEAFIGLHNLAKHTIHLFEALDSMLFLTDDLASRVASTDRSASATRQDSIGASATMRSTLEPGAAQIRQQLLDGLLYRRSLFRSTRLRLSSLEKRVSNSINLGSNLLAQQDSAVMIKQANSMMVIAVITVLLLPITAVAAVLGSDLFVSEFSGGDWSVMSTPLFPMMWYIAVPLTVVVVVGLWVSRKLFQE
jgi:Mg2+ and Co2+ transporter CorA